MNILREKILQELTKSPSTMDYLVRATGSKPPSIRGRISELRKLGYKIILERGEYTNIGKYRLISKKIKNNIDILLEEVDKYDLYNVSLDYGWLAKNLKMSREDVLDVMIELNKRGVLIQTSNNSSKIIPVK